MTAREFEEMMKSDSNHYGVEAIFDPNRPTRVLFLYGNMGDMYRAGKVWSAETGEVTEECIGDVIERAGL